MVAWNVLVVDNRFVPLHSFPKRQSDKNHISCLFDCVPSIRGGLSKRSSIDDHGDAHGDDGLCNCIRHARVTGEIKGGRFVATAFELLPSAIAGEAEQETTPQGHDPVAGEGHGR